VVKRVGSLYRIQIDLPTTFAISCNRHVKIASDHLLMETTTKRRKTMVDPVTSQVALKLSVAMTPRVVWLAIRPVAQLRARHVGSLASHEPYIYGRTA
jgi:hypothetical protein